MTTNANENNEKKEQLNDDAKKLIAELYNRSLKMLQIEFEGYQVKGQLINHPNFGPLFAYQLTDNSTENVYACGFFINEMLEKHKDAATAQQWLASFFVDMISEQVSKPLPIPPQTQEESKKLLDQHIIPHCLTSVREEFSTEKVYVNIAMHEKAGAVLEAGFPDIKEGNNVCAMPIPYLITLHLMNRDPAEPLVNGLYLIREQLGLE
ncbi:hypothetical protein ACFP56_00400 [Paenibacillus septentrionalis]|uniref:Uncharacterized protein n=1 Tax=Paenibacillus septentrionalis TaxID=429342 RepID=A0ABW1UX99_9BACL